MFEHDKTGEVETFGRSTLLLIHISLISALIPTPCIGSQHTVREKGNRRDIDKILKKYTGRQEGDEKTISDAWAVITVRGHQSPQTSKHTSLYSMQLLCTHFYLLTPQPALGTEWTI